MKYPDYIRSCSRRTWNIVTCKICIVLAILTNIACKWGYVRFSITSSKNQPTRLLRNLMVEMFTIDELRYHAVREKGTLPALDQHIMNAILCMKMNLFINLCYYTHVHTHFTMAKAEEWGQPITVEALVF